MITKADIKQETNSVSYNRGKKIYEEQKVHAFQVQEMEDIFGYQLHKITAVVDGSGKCMYHQHGLWLQVYLLHIHSFCR